MINWIQTIGTDRANDVALNPRPGRSAFHAQLRKLHGRLFLRDLDSDGGTWVNQQRIPAQKWVEVSVFDTVELGAVGVEGTKPARLSFTPSMYWGIKGALGLSLETTRLDIRIGSKTLCDGAFARVRKGRICAIIGRAGCGKSIFLESLAGLRQPTSGKIYLADSNLRVEPHKGGDTNYIAFVPQADVLISDLTVEQSLESRISLVYPGMQPEIRGRIVRSIAESLGFQGERLGKFLATRIGSPEIRAAVLSGGERRRASVGHEMVTNPMALLLDEPTSGLSSVDAFEVVQFLKRTAQSNRIPIAVSIHQPANDLFALFDDLLVMAFGGRMLYHGPAEGASTLLKGWVDQGASDGEFPADEAIKVRQLDGRSAEFFLKVQENPKVRDYLVRRFEEATQTPGPQIYGPLPDVPTGSPPEVQNRDAGSRFKGGTWLFERFLRITWELVDRSLATLRADRMNLRFMLIQAPLLSVLICFAFSMGREKIYKDDQFARTVYWGKEITKESRDMTLREMLVESGERASNDLSRLGEGHARLEATVMFVLAFAVLWLSTVGAAKEIVQDYGVIAQESRSGVGILPVVISRFVVLSGLSALQSAMLLGVVGVMLLKTFRLSWYVSAWEALILCGALSTAVGLVVSVFSSTYRLALTIVPLITIPQVLFSGVLQTVPIVTGPWTHGILSIFPLRMAWEGLLQVSPLWGSGIIVLEGQSLDKSGIGAFDLAQKMVNARVEGFRELYFGGGQWVHQTDVWMLCECLTLLAFSILYLKWRIRRGIR